MNIAEEPRSNRMSGDDNDESPSNRGTIWRRDSIDLDPFEHDGNSNEDF